MTDDNQAGASGVERVSLTADGETPAVEAPRKPLSDAARRALAEAKARRAAIDAREAALPPEHDGRGGRDPVRYGDWEKKGLAIDF